MNWGIIKYPVTLIAVRQFIQRNGFMRCCSRSLIILIGVSLLLLHPVWGGDVLAASPAIHFENDVFTFEPILEGESIAIGFAFRNMGEEPLVIHDAATSCGCTTADYPNRPLRPGEVGTIKTTFHSKGHGGDNDIVLLVKSNDPGVPVKTLHIKGKVIRQWQVKPDRFILTHLKPRRSYAKRLQIVNLMDEPLKIKELIAGNPHINLICRPKEVKPQGEKFIGFEVNSRDLKPGKIKQSSIRIVVGNARMKSVEIPILIKLK